MLSILIKSKIFKLYFSVIIFGILQILLIIICIRWNVIIISGVIVGNNCVIRCGNIVTKSFPDNSGAFVNPYKVLDKLILLKELIMK